MKALRIYTRLLLDGARQDDQDYQGFSKIIKDFPRFGGPMRVGGYLQALLLQKRRPVRRLGLGLQSG